MSAVRAPSLPGEPGWTRWLAVLLVPMAMSSELGAALPLRSYFFRDFTVTFLPLRLFAARELREGRFTLWNPYVFEGTFQLPSLYPPELLHALWPSPVFVSWLLTLHLPLAALGAYWLVRELGASRSGGLAAGVLFALSGFSLSCLNLYVFLQALALAPFVIGLLRRAALRGGGWCVAAAVSLALATSTLAVEFVAQALLLGLALAVVEGGRRGLARLGLALGLGLALAGLPVMLVLGLLPETARGVGFEREVSLANAVHPAVLLQALLPRLFGLPGAPAEAWWGGRFFSKGLPYFLSLYVGPLGLSLAALGLGGLRRRVRVTLLVAAGIGAWYALGEPGVLASLVQKLPFGPAFRFPSKALLLPHLALAIAAGFGVTRLQGEGAFARLALLTLAPVALGAAVAAVIATAGSDLQAWTGVRPAYWPELSGVAIRDATAAGLVALATLLVALAVRRRAIRAPVAAVLLTGLLAADLARAGGGLGRQVDASFFDPLPETRALPLRAGDGSRVFSYGLDHSPAFRGLLARGGRELTLAGFFVDRQILGPYTNMLDEVETTEAADLTAFAPRRRELTPDLYEPDQVGRLIPWLRNAAVSRIVSVDPLSHPDLTLLGEVALGPPQVSLRLYRLERTWARAHVACRVRAVPDVDAALLEPYRAGFVPETDAALAVAGPARCTSGRATVLESVAGREPFEVEADGDGYLVVRASYARGWRAEVDGRAAPVLRANGKHRAVPVPAGRHRVLLSYHPPGLASGVALSALAALGCLVLLVLGARARPWSGPA